ncbi:MAG TPA: hypothetical protein VIL60_02975 [Rhodanobacter sp.]
MSTSYLFNNEYHVHLPSGDTAAFLGTWTGLIGSGFNDHKIWAMMLPSVIAWGRLLARFSRDADTGERIGSRNHTA